ncbi:MAG TPA: DUF938 domain-containing protein [Acetobacteraceae bacterium]|nr:DUF938 domain-containing protein [Acetobacteraceae bacterium]
MTDPRLHSAATQRNRGPILAVLNQHLPQSGRVLEVASGSGEHIIHLAGAFPALSFQPSDPSAEARASIDARIADAGLANVRPAIALDAAGAWPVLPMDAVLCINMVHISPWEATIGLMQGAARTLVPGGLLYLYGPYRRAGRHTAPSNAEFDRSLRARNPAWGVRDLEAVTDQAAANGLALATVEPMPANNLSVIFRK